MKRNLICSAVLSLGLLGLSCGSDDEDGVDAGDGGTTTDARVADGPAGTTDVPATGTPDTAGGMGTGDAPPASVDMTTSLPDAPAGLWSSCENPKPGVSGQDFCAHAMTNCGFTMALGKFASIDDCLTRYAAYTDAQKGCAAYHVCLAGTPPMGADPEENRVIHCPHVAAAGGNPCMLP